MLPVSGQPGRVLLIQLHLIDSLIVFATLLVLHLLHYVAIRCEHLIFGNGNAACRVLRLYVADHGADVGHHEMLAARPRRVTVHLGYMKFIQLH